MTEYAVGDIVMLTSGSMRMVVEKVEDDLVHTVWSQDGLIGRDAFPAVILRKWEVREDDRGHGNKGPRRDDRPRGDKPQGKPGWDGKPREKKYFRKD